MSSVVFLLIILFNHTNIVSKQFLFPLISEHNLSINKEIKPHMFNYLANTNDHNTQMKNPNYASDKFIWDQIKLSFYRTKADSVFYWSSELIKRFPKSEFINDALHLLLLITDIDGDTASLNLYAEVLLNYEIQNYNIAENICREIIKKNTRIAEYAYLMLCKISKTKNQINQAIAFSKEFLDKFPKSKLVPQVKYNLGLIYLNFLNDTLNARDIFEDLIFNSPTAPESYWARIQLANLKNSIKHTH
ncbi:MAG: tetratricopeptide repeat protein [candidate division WOR-3 bacterium]|nr:tetratricopeptide repeat protein [candidate division WOR-3 bacterium]